MPARLVEAGHLPAGEVAPSGVVGDADGPVGEQVGLLVAEVVGELFQLKALLGSGASGAFR